MAIGDVVKSTLGPKGMNKILQSGSTGEISVTNDGATILKSIQLDNAAAKILVNISKVQDDEVGDGTTSVCVLASELLREAEKLVASKIHPQTIVEGYRIASKAALESLEQSAIDNGYAILSYPHRFLTNVAKCGQGKVQTRSDQHCTNHHFLQGTRTGQAILCRTRRRRCPPVTRIDGPRSHSNNQKSWWQAARLVPRLWVHPRQDHFHQLPEATRKCQNPHREHLCVLLSFTFVCSHSHTAYFIAMDTDKIKVFGARVRVDGTGKLAELERAEKEKMKAKVAQIAAHGVNVFVNRQLVYNYPEQLLAESGVMVIEHADFEGVERLSLVTGGEIVSTFDAPEKVKLGRCDLIEEVMIGEDKVRALSFDPFFQWPIAYYD